MITIAIRIQTNAKGTTGVKTQVDGKPLNPLEKTLLHALHTGVNLALDSVNRAQQERGAPDATPAHGPAAHVAINAVMPEMNPPPGKK